MNTWLAIAIVIVVIWALGFFALPGIGSLIHILLVIALVLVL
ncbi:lmo0937 family membrane protein, partial [Candidatus Bathyarchaeota archaeon]|nr:lmo0937 family membrane protein [Candidatus Bathyarchaeota archaeon]